MFKRNPHKNIVSSRNAQADGGSAAVLVAVIALLIVFYLLFIPPSFRDQILEGNESGTQTSTGTGGATVNETILKATPGTLSTISSEDIEHTIPSVTLYSKKNSEKIESLNSLSVKSSIFSYQESSMQFSVDDLENTDNILLSFISKKRKGDLTISVNDNQVFSGEITSENPSPVTISNRFVVEGDNKITFTPEKAGFRFWRVNRHNLENLQITGDVKDISQQKSKNIFIVSATEKSNVKRDVLRFTPDCVTGKTGKLNVLINQHSVYYSVPDCGGAVAIEFAPDLLREGENNIVFDSEQGNYLIDLIKITSEMNEVVQPTYYFEVSSSIIQDIRDGKYSLVLKLTFAESTQQKAGTLKINGRETNIYQTDKAYTKNIDDYIVDGSNSIKIDPETRLEIVSMEVVKAK